MNLRKIANSVTKSVNPNISATWKRSTGYTTLDDGTRVPTVVSSSLRCNAQPVPSKLRHLDNLNVAGVLRSVYCYPPDIMGVVRPDVRGGDFLEFAQVLGETAQKWKVLEVVESWPTWSHVVVVLQND